MALVQKEVKVVVLLKPQEMVNDYLVIRAMQIVKMGGIVDRSTDDTSLALLKKHFPGLPAAAQEILVQFRQDAIDKMREQIRSRFAANRAGIAFDPYLRNAMIRSLHALFESLKPFAQMIPWYHGIRDQQNRVRFSSCTINAHKPQLQFNVSRDATGLALQTLVRVQEAIVPMDRFNRYQFLLESNNEYFLLSHKDYLALEWLEEINPSAYARQPEEFATLILAKLEADYPVNRNNLFEVTAVTAVAENRVMLSEISQSFLVLTPQWLYDGYLVEGPWKEKQEFQQNGKTYAVQRDQEAEMVFRKKLESLHPNFPRQLNGYYYLSFADAQKKQWFLKVYHKLLEENIQLAGMDMLQHFRYSSHKISVAASISSQDNQSVTIAIKVHFGPEELPIAELQKIILAGQRSVLLKDGSLGILHEEWLQQYGLIFRHGRIINKELRVPRWLAFSEQKVGEEEQLLKPVIATSWWDKWRKWQNDPVVYPVPNSVKATLRPYQQKGYEWMLLLGEAGAGGCLADDMGLGKTLQTICLLAYRIEHDPGSRHLIVCPSSLIYNWQRELEKFLPSALTLVHHGAGRSMAALEQEVQVVITSYGTVRSDIAAFSAIAYTTVVLDESHTIKNPSAQVTTAVNQLQAAMRIALSGTPVMNNTFDLYAQLNFLLPGMFGSQEFFRRQYADSIDRHHDPEKTLALQKLTAPFILRRTKQQVASDLPDKTEMIMWCSMGPEQKLLYEEIKTKIGDSIFLNIKNEGLNKSKLALLQGMMKLRQLCNSPLLLPEEEQVGTESVKTTLLMNELCNDLRNHKVLVFSQFTRMLHLLGAECQEQGIPYYHFDGQTPPVKRAEMVANFQEEGNPVNVFLISLKAGNAGLNLTAADYVFLFDPWWNTAVQQQAIDRTHRIGQTKNVFAYKMICKDTIEEKIIQIQQRKQLVADGLVVEEEGFVKSLSEEDVRYLFS